MQGSKNTFVLGVGTRAKEGIVELMRVQEQGAPMWCPGFGRGNVHVIIFMAWH